MASPLKGGAKLAQYLRETEKEFARNWLLRVGFLQDSTHTSKSKNGETVPTAQVAAWNEWGDQDKGRPPRPFFRNMVQAKKGGWGKSLANIMKNTGNMEQSMALMGEGIKGQLQSSINEFTDPPLAESTIKEKGFDKPLIDTAEMLRAVDFQVFEGEDATAMATEEGSKTI